MAQQQSNGGNPDDSRQFHQTMSSYPHRQPLQFAMPSAPAPPLSPSIFSPSPPLPTSNTVQQQPLYYPQHSYNFLPSNAPPPPVQPPARQLKQRGNKKRKISAVQRLETKIRKLEEAQKPQMKTPLEELQERVLQLEAESAAAAAAAATTPIPITQTKSWCVIS